MTYRKRPRREYGNQRRVKFKKLASRVPDIDDPRQINYWDFSHNKPIYVEGWADPCFSGTGLGEYDTQAKINYAADLTPGILTRKEQEKGLKLLDGRFVETPDKDFRRRRNDYFFFRNDVMKMEQEFYEKLLKQIDHKKNIFVVDGDRDVEEIHKDIVQIVQNLVL